MYNFFNQFHTIVLSSLEYARRDARFYAFWRIYLAEEEGIKNKVKKEFPELTNDFFGEMIDAAIEAGQINPKYDQDFAHLIIELHFNNLDKLVNVSMTDDEIRARVEQVISFFKDSLALPHSRNLLYRRIRRCKADACCLFSNANSAEITE